MATQAEVRTARLATLPKPTTGRVVSLALALAAIGGFAGNALHTALHGEAWVDELTRCTDQTGVPDLTGLRGAGADLAADLAANAALQVCRAESEQLRGWFQLGGWIGIAAISLAVILLAPVVVRRRRRLRDPGAALDPARDRIAELSAAMGLRTAPTVALGSSAQRDAFCFGAPGRPVLVLPPAVAVRFRRPDLFDPVVRHELAHVQHRDVSLAWLARSFLLVAGLAAVVPLLTTAIGAPLSAVADYLWRVVALVGLGFLVARAVLRTREHDADLVADAGATRDDNAASGYAESTLRRLLGESAMRPVPAGWRRWVAHHPTPAERIAVLEYPATLARTGFVGGFLPAFFAAVAAPAVLTMTSSLLTGATTNLESFGITALAVGLALGGSVGVDAWRAANVAGALRDGTLAAGVGLGILLGQLAAPQNAWTGAAGGLPWWALVLPGVLATGATVTVCGMSRAAAGRRVPVGGVVVAGGLVLGLALWAGWMLQVTAPVGLAVLPITAVFGLQGWVPVIAVLLAAGLAVASRGQRAIGDLLVGALAGCIAGAVLAVSRLLQEPLATDAERIAYFHLVLELTIASAVLAAAGLCVLGGPRGAAAGLVALPAAVVTCIAAFLVLNAIRGGTVDLPFLESLLHPTLVVGALGVLLVAPLALLPGGGAREPLLVPSMILAGTAALLGALLLVPTGPLLLPDEDETAVPIGLDGAGLDGEQDAGSPADASEPTFLPGLDPSIEQYLTLAPPIDAQVAGLAELIDAATEGTPSLSTAQLLRSEVQPTLDGLANQLAGITPSNPDVAAAHVHLRDSVSALDAYLQAVIAFHEGTDPNAPAAAATSRAEAVAAYQRWNSGVAELRVT